MALFSVCMAAEIEYTPLVKRPACRSGIVAVVVASLVAILVVLMLVLIPKHVKIGNKGPEVKSLTGGYVVDGGWSDWKAWSTCSKSCDGGMQSRVRTCSNPSPMNGGRGCLGNGRETRSCEARACPDCSRPCPLGGTLIACAVCRCAGETYSGVVRDSRSDLPLQGVEVFSTHQLWTALAVTNGSGYFEISDICLHDPSLSIQFHKAHYLPASTRVVAEDDATNASTVIAMKKIELPYFVQQPTSQAVFVGGWVNFTCLAEGDPAPHGYQWYHNDYLLDEADGNVLVLTNINTTHSGEYKCRVITTEVKRFSRPTSLIVKASGEDTCDVTPSQRWVTLPPYCGTQDATGVESRHVDLGQCQPDVCRFRNQTANQGPSHCCGPIRSRTQQVTCRGFSYNLVKIEQCGCVACHLGHTKMMRGTVQIRDKSGTRPFSGALYVFEGTAYLTDNATGSFQLEVPQDAQRIVLRFPATSALYLPQVKVLHLDIPGNHFEHEVILQNQHHVVDFNPSLNKTLRVESHGSRPDAVIISLPANTVVTRDGGVLDETVPVYIGFSDPRERNNLLYDAGEFRYITEEGNERHLLSYGIVQLRATTGSGEPLLFNGDMKVVIHGHFLGLESRDKDVSLWLLDEDTGRWREAKPLGYGDELGTQTLPISGTSVTMAIAKPVIEREACALKVAVFSDGEVPTPVPEIQVTAYTKSRSGISYVAAETAITDSVGQTCVPLPCGYIHEVVVHSPASAVHPSTKHRLPPGFPASNRGEEVSFQSPGSETIQDGKGPVHRLMAGTCQQPSNPDYQLEFLMDESHDLGSLYPTHPEPGAMLSWYRVAADHLARRVCMIRLEVRGGPAEVDVLATSYPHSRVGHTYGTYVTSLHSYNDTQDHISHKVACIQVRCANFNDTRDYTDGTHDNIDDENKDPNALDTNSINGNKNDADIHDFKGDSGKSVQDYEYDYQYYNSGGEKDMDASMTSVPTHVDITMDSAVTTHNCHFSYTLGTSSPITESSSIGLSLLLTPTQDVTILDGYFTARGLNAYERTLTQCMTSRSSVAEYICDAV